MGARAFGWEDAVDDEPEVLAIKMEERLGALLSKCLGEYVAYVEWFSGVLKEAGVGRLPVFFADFDVASPMIPPPPQA